jgi:hypothetical protein
MYGLTILGGQGLVWDLLRVVPVRTFFLTLTLVGLHFCVQVVSLMTWLFSTFTLYLARPFRITKIPFTFGFLCFKCFRLLQNDLLAVLWALLDGLSDSLHTVDFVHLDAFLLCCLKMSSDFVARCPKPDMLLF